MILKAFSVVDSKPGVFSPPFFLQSTGLAIRQFTDLANDEKTTVSRYPEDFSLHEIGQFDDQSGTLSPLAVCINLGLASAFKR